MIRLIALTSMALAVPLTAGAFSLDVPVACTLGQGCYIQHGMDHDPGLGASNFTCGTLTYDAHKGTDFALPSLAAQSAGVDVIAAASGVVRGVRSDMTDVLQGTPGAPDINDRACGNGVVIGHDDDWETQYCHMKQDTITVQTGQIVSTGQVLGQIGLSGNTEFPHLHLSVRHNGAAVDPFDPDGQITCGKTPTDSLWSEPVPFAPGGIVAAGFSATIPQYDAIKAGAAARFRMSATAPNLVIWGYFFGGRAGDQVALSIHTAQGEVFADVQTLDRNQAQLFRAGGRRTPVGGWPHGDYSGSVRLIRDGKTLDTEAVSVTLN